MRNFAERQFTNHDFVALLLSLLCQNGVSRIDERELEKKLFCYYKNPEFRELFQDIGVARGIREMEVDLYEGLYQEKYFSGNILFEQIHSDILYLRYDKDIDLSRYEQCLSDDGKLRLRQIARELGIRYKAECISKHKLNIYGFNPNCEYTLVNGKWNRMRLSFGLITDGDIDYIEHRDGKEFYYESPLNLDECVQLKDNRVAYVRLKNANFAIKQGLCDGKIRYCSANTEITEEEKLKQIVNIANQEYISNEYALTDGAPYVRKIVLK